ncbi:methylmalonyl-CoA/ethylmalonyl-CoA epimerase [Klebsormidium nitens]|uniref:Methylmalonyl-CoA epimerase, mitochondrial n=1 Tax=Klebsormidium nitens TaxID=105231 RepID=A0A1Y1IJJ6_KLENI|nr:methylmalonyl-CoA/ethylmalonyl-CoA epimerase [Klebsormidium nitens]|eukprot:GAQ88906.1 methylmalonyl-CoA/ethylmalonyl-CoA epimerase [Klebsormidium nitens]
MHQLVAASPVSNDRTSPERPGVSGAAEAEPSGKHGAVQSGSWRRNSGKQIPYCSHANVVEEHWTMTDAPADIPYSVLGLNHLAVAVPDLEAASEKYRTVFGASVSNPKPQPEHGVTVVFVKLPGLTIELLHPLGDASPIAKFLQKNPRGGLHHVCLTVDNINHAAQHLKESDVNLLGDGKPKIGAHGDPVVFLNPKDTNGVLVELEEASGEMHNFTHEKW